MTNSRNVVGDAVDHVGAPPTQGIYCITLPGSIDASKAVIVANTDYGSSSTGPPARLAWALPIGQGGICHGNTIQVVTGTYVGDAADDNSGGDELVYGNQAFYFVVP